MKIGPKEVYFIPGLLLAEGFYHEAVKPILESHFNNLQYSAALIGAGSEVLGIDTGMSTDHHWGPRVMLFLSPADFTQKRDAIRTLLSHELPGEYKGYSTNFSPPNPDDNGAQLLQPAESGPLNHRVEMFTLEGYFTSYLGLDINQKLDSADWLTFPFQKLRSIIAGKIFRDDLKLEPVCSQFKWYPRDVWFYIMASAWARIGQEEHLMGRAGFVDDEIGSALIGSRLVRDIMRLAFLMEMEYPPYPKWFGTAFYRLKSAARLNPALTAAVHAQSWKEREKYLSAAYTVLAGMHNNLGITVAISPQIGQFFGRPFNRINGERFCTALLNQIKDPEITSVLKNSPIGNIDLLSDNTDLLEDTTFRLALKKLYQ